MPEHYQMLSFLCISFKYPLEAKLPMNLCSYATLSLEAVYSPPAAQTLHLLLLWQGIAIQLLEISALLDIILSYDHMVFFHPVDLDNVISRGRWGNNKWLVDLFLEKYIYSFIMTSMLNF